MIPEGALVSEEAKAKISQLRLQGVQIIDKPYQETSLKGIAPDVVLPEGIAYTHRTGEGFDIYFFSNQTDKEQTVSPIFRQKHDEAVVYNPLTDEKMPFNGIIQLPAYGSLFIS